MRIHYCVAVFLLGFVCFASVKADEYGDISIQYVPMYSILSGQESSPHGYVEYLFRVKNRNTSNSKKVSVQLVPNGYVGNDYGIKSASGLVEVPAGQTAQLVVLQPSVPFASSGIEARIAIDGRLQRDSMQLNISGIHCDPNAGMTRHYSSPSSTSTPMSSAQVLVSVETPTAFRDLFAEGTEPKTTETEKTEGETGIDNELHNLGSSSGSFATIPSKEPGIPLWRGESDVDQWSGNWLAYTRFDAIVLTEAEMKSMPQTVWDAIRRFTETGGYLCVIGESWTPPDEWKKSGSEYEAILGTAFLLKTSPDDSTGMIKDIRKRLIERSAQWSAAMQSDTSYSRRYGYYHYGSSPSPGFFGDPHSLSQKLSVSKSSVQVPVKLISVLIIVFAVLIGPVNVYILSLKNKRIWLLWTVPLISIIASSLVLGANFIQEGFVRYSSSATVTILDQRSEEAISFGVLGYYSTLTPPPARFDGCTEMIAVANRLSQAYTLTTIPGGEQVLTSGWINPRIPSFFGIRKAESRKERLEFQWESAPPTVTNQLGVGIDELVVCAPDGKFYEARNTAAGQKAQLKERSKPESPRSMTAEKMLADNFMQFANWDTVPETVRRGMPSLLTPGMYVISFDDARNPFIEKGLHDATQYKNTSTIVGYFE